MEWIDQFCEMLFPLYSESMNIEEAYALKYKNLPKSIFKYRSVNQNSLKNLRENTVWLADPKSMNDPYDCAHSVDFEILGNGRLHANPEHLRNLPEDIAKRITATIDSVEDPMELIMDELLSATSPEQAQKIKAVLLEIRKESHEEMGRAASENFKAAFKFCSFSERVDSTLMWSHYADYHKGFCIEYDISTIHPTNHVSRFLYPAIYSEKIFDATPYIINKTGNKPVNFLHLNLAGLMKSKDWEYEKEWRLLFSNGAIETEQSYLMPTPKTVYLGSHINEQNALILIDICKNLNIPMKKMRHSSSSFNMIPIDINEPEWNFFFKE